jgi:tetratricopeptide (TPR) repeat protein
MSFARRPPAPSGSFAARRVAFVVVALLLLPLPGRADDKDDIRGLLARGDAAEALRRADRALAADPRNLPIEFLRGVALMDLDRNAESLAQFERMTQAYPELPDPWNNIALLHVRAGRLEPARQALESALRNDPGHRNARANLGLVHLMLAAQAWESLAASGPVDPLLARRLEAVRALLAGAGR